MRTKNDPEVANLFVERLRQAMKDRGMSQSELARRIGVRTPTVNQYLCKRKFPMMTTAVRIADALDVSLDWLCGVKEKPDEADTYRLKRIAESVVEGTRDTYACIQTLNKCARALVKWAEKYEIELESKEAGI